MKKARLKKLTLGRETLSVLEKGDLSQVAGGIFISTNPTCGPTQLSYCQACPPPPTENN